MGMLQQRKIFLSYAFDISQFEWGQKMFMLAVKVKIKLQTISLSIDHQCYIFGQHSLKAVLGCLPLHINYLQHNHEF